MHVCLSTPHSPPLICLDLHHFLMATPHNPHHSHHRVSPRRRITVQRCPSNPAHISFRRRQRTLRSNRAETLLLSTPTPSPSTGDTHHKYFHPQLRSLIDMDARIASLSSECTLHPSISLSSMHRFQWDQWDESWL